MKLNNDVKIAIHALNVLSGGMKNAVDFDYPIPFVQKVLHKLKKADLIKTKSGVGGGYELNKDIDNLTLLDVLKAFSQIDNKSEIENSLFEVLSQVKIKGKRVK